MDILTVTVIVKDGYGIYADSLCSEININPEMPFFEAWAEGYDRARQMFPDRWVIVITGKDDLITNPGTEVYWDDYNEQLG